MDTINLWTGDSGEPLCIIYRKNVYEILEYLKETDRTMCQNALWNEKKKTLTFPLRA